MKNDLYDNFGLAMGSDKDVLCALYGKFVQVMPMKGSYLFKVKETAQGRWYVVNAEGVRKLAVGFDDISDFNERGIALGVSDGRCYLIDKPGCLVLGNYRFDYIEQGCFKARIVRTHEGYGLFNDAKKQLMTGSVYYASMERQGDLVLATKGDTRVFLDWDGRVKETEHLMSGVFLNDEEIKARKLRILARKQEERRAHLLEVERLEREIAALCA
jgi:hypothetical protein